MVRKEISYILPFLITLLLFSSCGRNKYKVEGTSSITSLDGKMLFLKVFQNDGQWITV